MTQGNIACPLCYGRGGVRAGGQWLKCSRCFPRRTRSDAREDALRRYVTGNRNELARRACLRLGISERELDAAINTTPPSQEGLF